MLKYVVYVFVGSVFVVAALAAAQAVVIYQNAHKKIYDMRPFVRHNTGARLRFLFMGDSTAVGTGAPSNKESVAGFFAQDFPDAWIDNDSYNGRRLAQLVSEFPADLKPGYDLVVMQIGANDIMKFTPYRDIEREIGCAITAARRIGHQVVVLHSGNVGLAPSFIWPFDLIMAHRSRLVRRIYQRQAAQCGALYVDLFTERSNDLFLKDVPKYYCWDRLHPSGEGYRWWYQRIRATLDQAGVVLK